MSQGMMRRAREVDLLDVTCKVTVTRAMFGSTDGMPGITEQVGVAKVTAKATLWEAEPDEDSEEKTVVARAKAYAIDLDRTRDPLEALDEIGGDAFHVVEDIFRSPNIIDALALSGEVDGITNQLVIVESILVKEEYRGQRIGPRLLATLEDTLSGSGEGTLIVLQAKPMQWRDMSSSDLRRAQKKIAKSYESIGFTRFRGDIYWRHSAYNGLETLEESDY